MPMNDPKMYSNVNGVVRFTVTECLDEWIEKIKWRQKGNVVIDLGCGDGSVTCLFKKYLPKNIEKFVSCDISEKMLQYASENHGDENITFRLQDVEGVLPDDMKCSFSHAFSFFLFHWIWKQEQAFQNVYDLLTAGGECFLVFFADMPFYHVYDVLSRGNKWGDKWLKNIANDYLSPYYGMEEPDKRVKEILDNIGFVNINVVCKKMTYAMENVSKLKQLVRAVESHSMPDNVFEDFFEDFLAAGRDIGFIDKSITSIAKVDKEIILNYTMIVVHASKPLELE